MTETREATPAIEPGGAWATFLAQLQSRGPIYARYENRGEIARGGMGVVHLVHDADTLRTLALKVMRPTTDLADRRLTPASAGAMLSRFLEEAQITSQLDHPGIVPVHEIGLDEQGRPYFTMKHVEGETLKSVFEKAQFEVDGWNLTRVVHVLLKVCEAMAYAHWKGVIHRDLKPGNVMVGRFGEVYVMDWGLARLLGRSEEHAPTATSNDPTAAPANAPREAVHHVRTTQRGHRPARPGDPELTMNGDVIGTPCYMAPEQARTDKSALGPHTDVYAVGAMLYHLLTGHMPYTALDDSLTPQDVVDLLRVRAPEPIDSIVEEAPPELVAICDKAMARRIERRYASMSELAVDLRAYLENRVVSAYATGPSAQLRKWIERNKVFAATIAVIVICGSTFGSYGAWGLRNERDDALVRLDLAESTLTQARAAEYDADLRAREAARRVADLGAFADLKRLAVLRHEFARLESEVSDDPEPLRVWIDSARELLSRREARSRELEGLRGALGPSSPDDLARGLAIEELLAGLEMLNRQDHAGASIAAATTRLQAIEDDAVAESRRQQE